jgi:3alpha(or 20beta)-hydroxysteroid dehydrogenase
MSRLKGKVAFITGATGGIGSTTARLLLSEKAKVFVTDVDKKAVDALVSELGRGAAGAVCDVTDESSVASAMERCVGEFGSINVVHANAGIEGRFGPMVEQTLEDFERVIAVNLRGVFLTLKHGGRLLLAGDGGSMIATSSVAGLVGSPGLSPYVASKHGVVGLMRAAALELGPQGVRVNSVHPGPVDNRMMRSIEQMASPDSPATVKTGFEKMVPLGRYALNEDIANMVMFLASDESAYCNGSRFVVDGGFVAG